MIKEQCFFVPGPLPGMNEIIREAKGMQGSGTLYVVMKRKQDAIVMKAAREAGLAMVPGSVYISFEWREVAKRRDPSNIAGGGMKFVLDGLVKGEILQGDGWRHIHGFSHSWKVDKNNPGVLITIREGEA